MCHSVRVVFQRPFLFLVLSFSSLSRHAALWNPVGLLQFVSDALAESRLGIFADESEVAAGMWVFFCCAVFGAFLATWCGVKACMLCNCLAYVVAAIGRGPSQKKNKTNNFP